MSFELVAYVTLRKKLLQSIKSLIESKDKSIKIEDATDLDNLEDLLSKVTDERKPQCRLILRSIRLLDQSKYEERDKARILNSLAYFIHQQIEATYKHTSPTNSTLYKHLTTSLALSTDNVPDNLDLPDMYSALSKFLRSHIYIGSDPRKGYLSKQEFKFTDLTYKVEDDVKAIETKLLELRIINVDAAADLYAKQQKSKKGESKAKASGGGIFSSIFGGAVTTEPKKKPASKKAAKKEVVVEDEEEIKEETTAEVSNDSQYDEGQQLVLK